jgi:hypothetical protein
MHGFIPVADLCIRTWPPEDRLAAVINGYFDDSQSPGDLWVVAGFVGYVNQWEHLESLWNAALAAHGVPYFHMREMADPDGVYAKWHPPEDHYDEIAAFFKDLVDAIIKCNLQKFSSAVWLDDVARFNRDKGLALQPYALAAYSCTTYIGARYRNVPVTAIFDHVEKIESKLKIARSYVDSDNHLWSGLCDLVTTVPLARGMSSRKIPAMQTADLIAWEARKAFFNMKPWHALPDRPLGGREAQWNHFLEWTREMTGKDPVLRKSFESLISQTADRHNNVVWDYSQLAHTHDAKRGIWIEGDGE